MFRKSLNVSLASGSGSSGQPTGAKSALAIGGALVVVAIGAVTLFSQKSPEPNQATEPSQGASVENAAQAPTGEKVQLQMWDQEEAENAAVIDSWIAKFETQNPNIKITRQTYPNEDLRTKFTMAATGGQAADIVWGPNDIAGGFTTANLIQPVEGFVDEGKFSSQALGAVKLKGKTMGVPATYGNHLILMYNKSIVPTPPTTTDELIEVAKKFSNPAEKKYGFVMFQNEPFWLAPIIGGFGGWPLEIKDDGNATISLDNEPVKNALAFVKDLKFKHQVVPPECDYDCAKGLFLEEKSPLHVNGDWSVREYRQKLGEKLGIAPLPIVSATNKPMVPMVSGRYVFINATLTPEKTAAVKSFVNFLTSKDVQLEVATKLERIPVTLEAQQDATVTSVETVKLVMEAAVNGRPMPAQTEMRAAWDAMRPIQQKIMAGDLEPDAAVAQMQQSAVEKLASLKN